MITEIRCVNHFKCTFKQSIYLFSIENQKTNANRHHIQLAVRMFVFFFPSIFRLNDYSVIRFRCIRFYRNFNFRVRHLATTILMTAFRFLFVAHASCFMPSARPMSFECE